MEDAVENFEKNIHFSGWESTPVTERCNIFTENMCPLYMREKIYQKKSTENFVT